MNIVVIQGGIVQDMSRNVRLMDLDDLSDPEAYFASVIIAIDDLRAEGFGWAATALLTALSAREDTAVCTQCGQWLVKSPDAVVGYVDASDGEVCVNDDLGQERLHSPWPAAKGETA